jgi:hypothetical protein
LRFFLLPLILVAFTANAQTNPLAYQSVVVGKDVVTLWEFSTGYDECPKYYKVSIAGKDFVTLPRILRSCFGLIHMSVDRNKVLITTPSNDSTGATFFYSYILRGTKWLDKERQ